MPQRLTFDFRPDRAAGAAPRARRGPLRLLLLGDFGGSARAALAERPTLRVDAGSLDDALRRVAPRLTLASGEMAFATLDDFHPDGLYRLPLFDTLRTAREQPPASAGRLLGTLLGAPPPVASAPAAPAADALEAFVRRIVAPHVVPDDRGPTDAYRNAVDAALAEPMRAVLHDPAFQALEAAWRGVQWLASSLDLDAEDGVQLHLLDAARDELLADIVAAGGRLAETGLHRALAERWRNQPGGEPWHLIAALYRFGAGDTDIGLLAALGLIAGQAGGPLVAAADAALADCADDASWQALRASEAAAWIGLAAPRVLLRLPYGRRLDSVEAFAFEEFVSGGAPEHEALLWGNPALAIALLAGRSFEARGWDFEAGDVRELDGLPAYAFERDGERVLQPVAERLPGGQWLDRMIAAGLMPLASHAHAAALTVPRLHNLAGRALF